MKRRHLLFSLTFSIVLSSAGITGTMAKPSNTAEGGKLTVPSKYTLKAAFDRRKYFLGENALVDFVVENSGESGFAIDVGGDYRGSPRSTRFTIKATAADGTVVSDPHPNPMCLGGLGGPKEINRANRWVQSLPLMQYCRIEKPGKYKIAISHDLGWGQKQDKQPTAFTEVEFVMPNAKEAQAVIDKLMSMKQNESWTFGEKRADFPDFTVLQMPVYLNPLLNYLQKGPGSKAILAVDGIGSIATPDATKALLDAANNKDPKVSAEAVQMLVMRLPDPALKGELGRRNVFENSMPDERSWMVKRAWQDKFAPQVRELAQKLMKSKDQNRQAMGAFMLQCVGNSNSLKTLTESLDKALIASKTLAFEVGIYPRPRGNVSELMRTAEVLAKPADISEQPQSPGQMALYMSTISHNAKYRPANWQSQYERFMHSDIPYLRELALTSMPAPVPARFEKSIAELLNDKDIDVQIAACNLARKMKNASFALPLKQALGKARESFLINASSNALFVIDRTAALQVLASRLGEPKMNFELLSTLLSATIEYQTSGSRSSNTAQFAYASEEDEGARIKPLWQKFLADNHDFFAKRGRLKIGDPRLKPDLLPRNFCIGDATHQEWPPVSKEVIPAKTNNKKTQELLKNQVKAVLPAGWSISSTHAATILPEWKSKDQKAGFVVEAKSGSRTMKVCFLPLDWIGIYQSQGKRPAYIGDNILLAGNFKAIIDTNDYQVLNQMHRMFNGAYTASLLNSEQRIMQSIFAGKETEADQVALSLIKENCHTPAQLVESALSLIRLGVPANSVFIKVLEEARTAAIYETDFFISAVGVLERKKAIDVLCKVVSDPAESDHVRRSAILELNRLDFVGDPKCAPLFTKALKQMKSEEDMAAVITVIANTKGADKVILEVFPRFDNPFFQLQVAEILANLHCKEALPQLRKMLQTLKSSDGHTPGGAHFSKAEQASMVSKASQIVQRLEKT